MEENNKKPNGLSWFALGFSIASPKVIIDEVTRGGSKFTRKGLYIIMVKFIAPAFLLILLLQALGIVSF